MKTETLALPTVRARASDFVALTKPRLNFLVVATAATGYYLGANGAGDPVTFLNAIVGTALVAGGASAFNQIAERDVDGLMRRTRLRPMPDGRLQLPEAGLFASALSVVGLLQLALGAGLLAAIVALATLVSYTTVYTPLKRRTSLATIIGAIPGALPPVIGWTAARSALDLEAWVLFAIVFLWQMPHFLAIGWLYRDDYERAGFPLLPVVDPDGRSTARQALLYTSALVPVSLAPVLVGLTAPVYAIGAAALGLAFVALAFCFVVDRTAARARRLFVGSIAYLPLLWALMIIC